MSFLVLEGIKKSFGGFYALSEVNLSVKKNSIHAILGENGAGKTTLMNVLFGLYHPNEGRVCIDDKAVEMHSPADAISQGIGMVHQHMHLANALTVTENIVLGLGAPSARINIREHSAKIRIMSTRLGLEVEPDELVWKLPIGTRQRVEILKALYRGAKILVLDEPTSVLAINEIASFLARLKFLRDSGTTILFVTHKLDEVMAVADEVSVLRQGKIVADRKITETSPRELSRLMVGRDVPRVTAPQSVEAGGVVLECHEITALSDRGLLALDKISLQVRAGEILAITGVDGNGQDELAEVICGLRVHATGRISASGQNLATLNVRERQEKAGIGFVPQDRQGTGLVLDYSIALNFILRTFSRPPVSQRGLLNLKFVNSQGASLMSRYDVRAQAVEQSVRDLSGGNQQKIIAAREIEAKPRILIIMQPTKGLDVGAIEFIQTKILEERARGAAILYISTELEHVVEVADRIAVIHRGKITGELKPSEVTAERIGMLMTGASLEVA